MRMWGGLLTRATPSFVQVMAAAVEFAVQYSQITDCSTMLCTPPLFWKRAFGRGVIASWVLISSVSRNSFLVFVFLLLQVSSYSNLYSILALH